MEPVVTSEEMDALMAATQTDVAVRRYDFRVPDKFSKEQLRTLVLIHDGFARNATSALSAYLRTTVQVQCLDCVQGTYQQFLDGTKEPVSLAIIAVQPLGTAVLELDAGIAFPMIDRLLGGPGQGVHGRALTDIETAVVHRVLGNVLDAWRDAWRSVLELHPVLVSIESNPLFAQVAGPGEIVLIFSFSCTLGAHTGRIRLCVPFTILEPALPRLSAQRWYGGRKQGEQAPERLAAALSGLSLPIAVELGSTSLTVSEVLALRVGDVVPLAQRAEALLVVSVGDRPKFLGRPGRRGKRLAVKLEARWEEGA